MPDSYKEGLLDSISAIRTKHSYTHELHYSSIKGARRNKAFEVAREWLTYYFEVCVRHCPFKAFIVEYRDERPFPYPGEAGYPEHAAHSLMSSFVSGIAWSYHHAPSLELRLAFDGSDNEVDRHIAETLAADLPGKITAQRLEGKPYPSVTVRDLEFIDSNPLRGDSQFWGEAELVQLCDILLGAAFDALSLRPVSRGKSGRIQMAQSVSAVLANTVQLPWLQSVPVHRRYSVSLYPDDFNFAYPAYLRGSRAQEGSRVGAALPLFSDSMFDDEIAQATAEREE